jgi:hypothetical protein
VIDDAVGDDAKAECDAQSAICRSDVGLHMVLGSGCECLFAM